MQLVFLTSLALATLASAYPKAAPDASTARRAVPAVPTHVTYGFGGAFISDSTANSNPTAKLFINNAHPNDWGDCIPFNHNTNSMRATTSIRCVFFKDIACADVIANLGGLQGSNSPDTTVKIDDWSNLPLEETALSARCKAA